MEHKDLLTYAKQAMENAYAPYSHFRVGAAVLTKEGQVFGGCNIENASYGATCCGERTAIFQAVSQGVREFTKIAIVSSAGGMTPPCGICRQVLWEFMPDGEVVLEDEKGEPVVFAVKDLLPMGFSLEKE